MMMLAGEIFRMEEDILGYHLLRGILLHRHTRWEDFSRAAAHFIDACGSLHSFSVGIQLKYTSTLA